MGLLDNAIREHLELRRRHGVDSGLIAREEHDVFGPGGEPAYEHEADEPDVDADGNELDAHADPRAPNTAEGHGSDNEFSHVGQETAELDMSSVLEAPDELSLDLDLGTAAPMTTGRPVDREWDHSQHPRRDPASDGALALDDDLAAVPTSDQERLWLDESSPRDSTYEA